ncbi:hypothetical protein RRG08_056550 [Elysia crispata]|uniref:Uncharacterized protein n=1 Tax=Elysia crispata TaxID=231223 RepID=A0AAE1CX29_9GAST|nr:hypothetical protein RRG08_056550 [Elysia crispata]
MRLCGSGACESLGSTSYKECRGFVCSTPRTRKQNNTSGQGTMNGVLLVVSLALMVNLGLGAAPCDARGRSCVSSSAECINGKCVCKAPNIWGDGAFNCYRKNTVAAQVFNDPMLTNFNNESLPFPYPCRYLLTHFVNELKDDDRNVIGSCEIMVHSFNAKYRGKFFLHGFDVALAIKYDSGKKVKLSSRHYGVAKYGRYVFKNRGTEGKFWQNGPWQRDDINYEDPATGVKVEVYQDPDNNQLVYEAKRCGYRATFVPYDIKDRRAQVSLPGMSFAVNCAHHPKWMSLDEVMALAPWWQKGSLFADNKIPGLTVEQSIFVRAFTNGYVQNMPMKDKGKCAATQKAFGKCTRPELRKAMKNCYWMLKQPRFIYCMDKSKSARKILQLFSTCVKVWCANGSCGKAQDMIIKAGCDTVRDITELPAFMSGDMCPTD